MFFITSKVLAFLFSPANWLFAGFIMYAFTKKPKRKKIILIITLSLTFLLTNNFIFEKTLMWWQTPVQKFPLGKKYEAGILLGGLYSFDIHNKGYFNDCCDRFIETNKLYQSGIIRKIIISGGSAAILFKEPSEADSLKKEFLLSGVKEEDIIIDSRSRSTYENALYTKKLKDSFNLKPPYILITSAFHMPRSLKVFKKQNIDVVPITSNYLTVEKKMSPDQYILPNPQLINEWGLVFKEWVGIMVYSITGKA